MAGSLLLALSAAVQGAGLEPAADWTQLQVEVKDQVGKAFDRFTYSYLLINQFGDFSSPKDLKSEDGSIRLKAPPQCEIHFSIHHPEALTGYGSGGETFRNAGEATVIGTLERGATVRGRVIAESDGKPVAGAQVMPLKLMIPIYAADRERIHLTDANGEFSLPGVSRDARQSFTVEHPDFAHRTVALSGRQVEDPVEVKLNVGETIRGFVLNSDDDPLAGAEVHNGDGKQTLSGEDGSFVLKGTQKLEGLGWLVLASKEGYAAGQFRADTIARRGVELRLAPLRELRGQVLSADGSPATEFRVVCGPGESPGSFHCTEQLVKDAGGNFSIRPKEVAESGRYWLGIQAADAAPWSEVLQVGASGVDRRIVLSPGRKLTARLATPTKAEGPFEVLLETTGSEQSEYSGPFEMLKVKTTLKRGEPLVIEHLRPGNYLLKIHGKNATPIALPVTIKDQDLDVGELRMAGTGVIHGRVRKDSEDDTFPRYARGFIRVVGVDDDFARSLEFWTDAEGKFRVEGAPTGTLSVSFPIQSGCTTMAISGRVELGEGEEREVKVGLFGFVR